MIVATRRRVHIIDKINDDTVLINFMLGLEARLDVYQDSLDFWINHQEGCPDSIKSSYDTLVAVSGAKVELVDKILKEARQLSLKEVHTQDGI